MSLLLALQATGPVTITGTLAATESGDNANFSGLINHTGDLAVTEIGDSASFSGLINHVGSLAVTEGSDTAAFGGTLTGSAITITGDLAATEEGDSASFSGLTIQPIIIPRPIPAMIRMQIPPFDYSKIKRNNNATLLAILMK